MVNSLSLGTQKESPISILRTTVKDKGISGLYSGCTALVVGNSVKAGIRFVSYDRFKGMLADSEVCPSSCLYALLALTYSYLRGK